MGYMNFKENSTVRLVCRRLNELCAARLNSTFQRLQNNMLVRFQSIKSQMPRRESARRNHPLARECDFLDFTPPFATPSSRPTSPTHSMLSESLTLASCT